MAFPRHNELVILSKKQIQFDLFKLFVTNLYCFLLGVVSCLGDHNHAVEKVL